ncbi:BamA/TamA family outer membrane protein [Mangrovimonas yunxiaonensis]|uniref:hypothetical protein n=1 Tax=Mangrovimonas yunxiaonensis TaxID=1197477 RepID=UPI0019B6575D|nr:hypothetical protein [Mangrovimonas yunxiaonensis]GGH34613.1 membrane protein [Mangrovimonas yunxiaonensis]
MFRTLFAFLIIYCININLGFGQTLTLKIHGQDSLETQQITRTGHKTLHPNYQSVHNEIAHLKTTLLRKGYIETKVLSTAKANDSLVISEFSLGQKFDSIKVYYNNDIHPLKSYFKKHPNTIFNHNFNKNYFSCKIEEVETALNLISLEISDSGHPFTTLKLTNFIQKAPLLEATLTINKTKEARTIDNIIVKGYEKFPKTFLKHHLKITTGKPFSLTQIKKQLNHLNQIRFASKIKDPEALFTKDSTLLYLYLEKTKSNHFDGFLGFGTNEETGSIEFNGYLNLALNNNLNLGETFSLVYKSDENDQRTFNANLRVPYLFNSPIGTELQLNLFKKDSSFTTSQQSAKLFHPISPKNTVSAGIKSTTSNNLLTTQNTLFPLSDYDAFFYTVNYTYQNLNITSRLFPKKTQLDLELSSGKRTTDQTKSNQIGVLFNGFNIFALNNKNNVFVGAHGGHLDSPDYLENELYRFGGINSIRGFEENSIIANTYAVLNTEYRYLVSHSIYVHTIIDFAYLENHLQNHKANLYGFGLGFGVLTRAGLLKFNYANGKNDTQKFKFSNSQVHLSLTAFF